MSAAGTVTPNGSTQPGSDVTCHACGKYDPNISNRSWGFDGGVHCTSCHSDRHRACEVCGACLPNNHRWDRYYCGSTCRVLAMRERERRDLERIAWEAEYPEEAAKKKAEREAALEMAKTLTGTTPEYQAREKRIADIKRTLTAAQAVRLQRHHLTARRRGSQPDRLVLLRRACLWAIGRLPQSRCRRGALLPLLPLP